MKIGILMAGHAPDPVRRDKGDFDAMFTRLLGGRGFDFDVYDVENMQFPSGPDAADGWLVSGSRHAAYEDHAFIPPLEQFIRDVIAAGVPLVGICFGHQIIAQALGGRVEKFGGGWALGRRTYRLEDGGEIALSAWHQDQVVALPEGATRLASNGFCENAILAYGDRAFTVQAHPEFSGEIISAYVEARRGTGTYSNDMMDQAARDAPLPLDTGRLGDAIARFFKTRVAYV
ncbi:type 1 glutamine amidotransferase [Jannaschia seohaensis]|uniref:GMP synthase - Glutamine amidotransferase n=1 Tax=Jannaschia seohaensis TaxID=475081 RepID=A0A2Y9AQG0_9RHOB|nr:type 1 glutamine amidotransferase [Jannaschia seohaensis]PWJ18186.1 GMP synthase-like glutamine amidotransferase [Jannaschia seohaensis]SSA46711.1 GMP synthase - Glutamine amidotransferase [Jannaschia seohaensis]